MRHTLVGQLFDFRVGSGCTSGMASEGALPRGQVHSLIVNYNKLYLTIYHMTLTSSNKVRSLPMKYNQQLIDYVLLLRFGTISLSDT